MLIMLFKRYKRTSRRYSKESNTCNIPTDGLTARKMKIIECEVCHKKYIAKEFFKKPAIVMFDTDGNRLGSYDRISFSLFLHLPK
jgi:hypothetical protein